MGLRPDLPNARLSEVAIKKTKDAAGAAKVDESVAPDLPFEQAMSRLAVIVEELEGGQLSLEESLVRFEEGVRLARASQKKLDEAEAKVELLLAVSEDGTPETEEIGDP